MGEFERLDKQVQDIRSKLEMWEARRADSSCGYTEDEIESEIYSLHEALQHIEPRWGQMGMNRAMRASHERQEAEERERQKKG